ncbi:homocitrate synthase/isopropylmalate synthase family protein [Bacillus carboniphilus]|uniref:homocitrate synthase/isopropylmalate synthase family protein n=1 Tax=Bacillus carboniphilus TaxID=86663 RepID=UPI0035325FF5
MFPVVQWSAEDACRTELDYLAEIVEYVIKAGASVINIPDTVGYVTPKQYAHIFSYLMENVKGIENVTLSAHCHDDLGLAVANSLSAIEQGVGQIEGTINGIGERAGNASLEEIAVALHIRKDSYKVSSNLDLSQISQTSSLVSRLTGMIVPRNKAIVGKNAFAHEAGIHQDGVLKEKTTYEIISPQLVGVSSNDLVLGKHSGRHALKEKLTSLGFAVSDEELKKIFILFKQLADKKATFTDEDFRVLVMEHRVENKEEDIELCSLQVNYGLSQTPSATVRLKQKGSIKEEAGYREWEC